MFNLLKPQGRLYLETVIIDAELPRQIASRPFMLFYPKDTKHGDHTNYWGLTESCVVALLEENNFRVLSKSRVGERGTFSAIKEAEARDYYGQISRGLVE